MDVIGSADSNVGKIRTQIHFTCSNFVFFPLQVAKLEGSSDAVESGYPEGSRKAEAQLQSCRAYQSSDIDGDRSRSG